jgi:hypothetical protein
VPAPTITHRVLRTCSQDRACVVPCLMTSINDDLHVIQDGIDDIFSTLKVRSTRLFSVVKLSRVLSNAIVLRGVIQTCDFLDDA